MERHLDNELNELKNLLVRMAGIVENMIAGSVEALTQRNNELAQATLERDSVIDDLELEIEERGLELLALYQPVAGDLRLVTACMMISKDLERMGDLARNISLYTVRLSTAGPDRQLVSVRPMARLVQQMVRDAINAFVHRDTKLARAVINGDDEVDNFNDENARELKEAMARDSANVEPGFTLLLAVRALERVADHAAAIARDVVHCIEGLPGHATRQHERRFKQTPAA